MREIFECEVCGSRDLESVIDLGKHPLPDALLPIGSKDTSPTFPVEVLFCDFCCTAHQRFQVPKQQLFPPSYHYRARMTQDVLAGMDQLVASIQKHKTLTKCKVLDVGCNDGSLLTIFRTYGALTYGIEPTDAAREAMAVGHTVMQAFLDEEVAKRFVNLYGHPDIITFTNVFAHIEDLDELIRAVRVLRDHHTEVVIENHYLGSVLERHQFDTFYHEHPRTYSYTSFDHIAHRLGTHVSEVEFPQRYGGNIRVTLRDGLYGTCAGPNEFDFKDRLVDLGLGINAWKERKGKLIYQEFDARGPVACAAFPGRAAILIRLLDLPEEVFQAVYEKPGSKKIGYYVPGTRIPIVSDEIYPAERMLPATSVINMAWHIQPEIERRWRDIKQFKGKIVPCVEPADFAD